MCPVVRCLPAFYSDLSLRDVGLMLTASASLIKRMRKNEARLKQLEKEQRHAEFQSTVLMLRLNVGVCHWLLYVF